MPGDPYLDLRKRVQRRMEARLALAQDEVNTERSLRQIESALGLPRGYVDNREALMDVLEETFANALLDERVRLSQHESQRLFALVVGDMLGLGPVDPLLADPGVSAVHVLDTQAIYVERGGSLVPTSAAFDDDQQLNKIIRRVFAPMGYWLGEGTGLVSGHLPDGTRVDAVLTPDLSPDGAHLVVRKRPEVASTLASLVAAGMLPGEVADFLRVSLMARRNCLIAGPHRSGKTTLLEGLENALADKARLVVVEHAYEMALVRQNMVRLEARAHQGADYSTDALLRHAVALQPDWVWLGEVSADVAATYVEMLARVGLCATLALRNPDGSSATRVGPQQALDRLTALALQANPDLPDDLIEQQVAVGLDLLVLTGQDAGGMPVVSEVTRIRREGMDWQLESVYNVLDGSLDTVNVAAGNLVEEATRVTGERTILAGEAGALTQPLSGPDGSLADPSLDDLHLVKGSYAIGLREAEGAPVSIELEDVAGEIRRFMQAQDTEALLATEERLDGTRMALVRPPVAVGGEALSVERFAAQPGGLKRLADLGLLNAQSGGLIVQAARAGRSILVCGPAGSGKRALMQSMLRVLQDEAEWQVIAQVDADTLPAVLSAVGQGKTLAGLDCTGAVDPLAALGAWHATWSGESHRGTARTLAGAFTLVVRMGRVVGRQRMILSIEEIIAESDGYRLEALFAARKDDDTGKLTLVQVGQPTFG
jgi:Flp pilus assembly CpaF family ATPase